MFEVSIQAWRYGIRQKRLSEQFSLDLRFGPVAMIAPKVRLNQFFNKHAQF